MTDIEIRARAIEFAKRNKNHIARELTSTEQFRPDSIPISVFMAGSLAWRFTQAREKVEGRNIPKAAFIEQFLGAKQTVNKVSHEFSSAVSIFLVKKDFEKNTVERLIKIPDSGQVDDYIKKNYTRNNLERHL